MSEVDRKSCHEMMNHLYTWAKGWDLQNEGPQEGQYMGKFAHYMPIFSRVMNLHRVVNWDVKGFENESKICAGVSLQSNICYWGFH